MIINNILTNGVTVHDGAYTYDAAGRLSQVVDSATGLTETYTWNDDGTLASAPGTGYVKQFEYDEEQHLVRIAHNASGTVTTAYEYGYAADGGRRWKKDYAGNVWTWYPCGVACNAGELVEQTSDLTGSAWTTSALYLKAGSGCISQTIRRNGEYHHADIKLTNQVITDISGTVVSNNVYDFWGVASYISGSATTPDRILRAEEEGLLNSPSGIYLPNRGLMFQQSPKQAKQGDGKNPPKKRDCAKEKSDCLKRFQDIIDSRDGKGKTLFFLCLIPGVLLLPEGAIIIGGDIYCRWRQTQELDDLKRLAQQTCDNEFQDCLKHPYA